MRINSPDPRLPLEPEEYPLYRPPSRIGCSALTILPLILIGVFAFLFWRVTPQIANAIVSVPRQILNIPTSTPGIENTPSAGGLATQTVPVPVTPTVAIKPTIAPTGTPTPVVEYFKVANTGGLGVKLRAQPLQSADRVTGLNDGTVVKTIGTDQKNADGTWKHVSTADDQYSGWINANFLIPTTKP
jgi:hypothetical protein